ncbi:hypothetical protein CR194_04310 [Salipaludibacillus keqinensis]|uniref:Uncharacterized protein n=1 Tax=Salipaludibacillus keqinensis TaxID=2045207 RepID=A0A323TJL9_9BACI|nr:hypothetical protein [Salipaludibacillus keqinensis]PYZ94760.1 hypothetical protein CR194_04310 [Salipaludibacillus keqinensis]
MKKVSLMNPRKKKNLIIPIVIISMFIVFNIYVFLTSDSIVAQLLTVVSSIGFLIIFMMALFSMNVAKDE